MKTRVQDLPYIWTWGDKPAVKPFASDSLRASAFDAGVGRIK